MNVKSFFVTEESRLSILKHYHLPSNMSASPVIYKHGSVEKIENIPMSASNLQLCLQLGLLRMYKDSYKGNFFDYAFNEHFPTLKSYWEDDKVNLLCQMMKGHESDIDFIKRLALHIYRNFIDDHYHTVAVEHRNPNTTIHNKHYVLQMHDKDLLKFDADRTELFLPLIGMGTYFNKMPEHLTHIMMVVPKNNSIPDSILRKRLEYCNPIPATCKVEVIKE